METLWEYVLIVWSTMSLVVITTPRGVTGGVLAGGLGRDIATRRRSDNGVVAIGVDAGLISDATVDAKKGAIDDDGGDSATIETSEIGTLGPSSEAVYPWTVTLVVSPDADSDFEGAIDVLVLFENGTRRSTVRLPFDQYRVGHEYTFPVEFVSSNAPTMIFLRTRRSCDRLRKSNLRLDRWSLYSRTTGRSYVSDFRDLTISSSSACERNDEKYAEPVQIEASNDGKSAEGSDGSNGKAFFAPIVSKTLHLSAPTATTWRPPAEFDPVDVADLDTTDECSLDGIVYADGQTFDRGCRRRCACVKGSITCSDNCPSISTTIVDPKYCRRIHVPGRCCDEIRCDEEGIANADAPSCRRSSERSGTLKGELLNGLSSVRGDSNRYPWAVLICTGDDDCRRNSMAGVIVGERHVLTFAVDLQNQKRLRIFAGTNVLDLSRPIPDHADVRSVHAHSDFANSNRSRLQLIELENSFTFGTDLQAVNLPLDQRRCSKLSSVDCPVSAIGWESDATDSAARMFLRARLSTLDPRRCGDQRGQSTSKVSRPLSLIKTNGGEKRTCLSGLIGSGCRGESTGGSVMTTADDDVEYLIGLFESESDNGADCASGLVVPSVLPICRYLAWIRDTINN